MSMLQKVQRGVVPRAQRVVLYGVESVGKTTLAAQCPAPLFLDVEEGTSHIDVPRLLIRTWPEMEVAIKEIAAGGHGYTTLVVDSVDWAEKLAIEDMLARDKKAGIEDYGYGKGYVAIAERMTRWLGSLDAVIRSGVHVLLIAHAKVTRYEPPDGMQAYDRYELKLSKQTSPLVKEWADALLFAHFKTRVVEAESGRAKAIGGKERILRTQRSAAYDAKCRVPGIPEEIPMTWAALGPIFCGQTAPSLPEPIATEQAPAEQQEPEKKETVEQNEKGLRPLLEELYGQILKGRPENFVAARDALRKWGWLPQDGELGDLSDHHLKQIHARPAAFFKRIKEMA